MRSLERIERRKAHPSSPTWSKPFDVEPPAKPPPYSEAFAIVGLKMENPLLVRILFDVKMVWELLLLLVLSW
jgi:hypothetical protein